MSPTKNTLQRKSSVRRMAKVAPAKTDEEDLSEVIDATKIKSKAIEIELPEEPSVAIEEKVEDEAAIPAEDAEELASEEISLDDDELNPFGDKWEL